MRLAPMIVSAKNGLSYVCESTRSKNTWVDIGVPFLLAPASFFELNSIKSRVNHTALQ